MGQDLDDTVDGVSDIEAITGQCVVLEWKVGAHEQGSGGGGKNRKQSRTQAGGELSHMGWEAPIRPSTSNSLKIRSCWW